MIPSNYRKYGKDVADILGTKKAVYLITFSISARFISHLNSDQIHGNDISSVLKLPASRRMELIYAYTYVIISTLHASDGTTLGS